MPETHSSWREDISYLRRMAEQGQNGPILGGIFLLTAGLLFGTACLAQWWGLSYRPALAEIFTTYLWGGAFLLFAGLWAVLSWGPGRARGGCASEASKIFGMVWIGCAVGIILECIAIYAIGRKLHVPAVVTLFMPSVFVFYGMAWLVTGAMTHRRWMYGVSIAAFVFALVLAFMPTGLAQLPVMGAALYVTLSAPGLKLIRQEPKS